MGGQSFDVLVVGTDARKAFREAVEQAKYAHGHAGYTGTIAEKDSFVTVADSPLPLPEARALAERLVSEEDPRIDDKWGPAGCIPVCGLQGSRGDRGFLFFGWASS